MKTIQQWLAECDKEKLIDTYIYQYFNDLSDIPLEYRAMSLDELIVRKKQNTADCIEHLLSLDIIEPKNGKTGIIFGHNHYDSKEWAELVYAEELLSVGVECKTYAYEFTLQAKMVGFFLAENEYTQKNQYEIIGAFLHEATFFGWKQEYLQEAIEDLELAIKETQNGNAKAVDFDAFLDELSDRYGLDDGYQEGEEEEKIREEIQSDIFAFDNMCKKNALAEIIKLLQESGEC